jgi:hypothetical protein
MSEVATKKVYWPKKFGDRQVIINESDFDPKIHQVDPPSAAGKSDARPSDAKPAKPGSAD